MRCLPDMLKPVQKHECLMEERRGCIGYHQHCSSIKTHARIWHHKGSRYRGRTEKDQGDPLHVTWPMQCLISLSMYTILFLCGMYFLVLAIVHFHTDYGLPCLNLHACILTPVMDTDNDLWICSTKVYSKYTVLCPASHYTLKVTNEPQFVFHRLPSSSYLVNLRGKLSLSYCLVIDLFCI